MNTNPESSQQAEIKGETQARSARRQYSEEFKSELINACAQAGANISAVARSHAIRPNQLRRWLKKARSTQGTPTLYQQAHSHKTTSSQSPSKPILWPKPTSA